MPPDGVPAVQQGNVMIDGGGDRELVWSYEGPEAGGLNSRLKLRSEDRQATYETPQPAPTRCSW